MQNSQAIHQKKGAELNKTQKFLRLGRKNRGHFLRIPLNNLL